MAHEAMTSAACDQCGNDVEISPNWLRRKRRDQKPVHCDICIALSRVSPDEDDYWHWLEKFGVQRNGRSAREQIAENGLPPELSTLIGIFSD